MKILKHSLSIAAKPASGIKRIRFRKRPKSILITDSYRDAIVFFVLIVVLVIRPTGIFGEKIQEKA